MYLLLINLHYSMTNIFTIDGPEVCTQPFTVDESTLKYDKTYLLLINLHYSMRERITVDGPEVCTQPFEQLGGLARHLAHQHLAVLLDVRLGLDELQPPDVLQRPLVVADVLKLHLQVPLVLAVLVGQGQGVAVVARAATHPDGRLHVEVNLAVLRLNREREKCFI